MHCKRVKKAFYRIPVSQDNKTAIIPDYFCAGVDSLTTKWG